MSIQLEFISLVVRRDAARRAGCEDELLAQLGTNGIERADDKLWATGFMGPHGVDEEIARLERMGLRIIVDGRFADGAVVDFIGGPTLPCDWIATDGWTDMPHQAWIRGQPCGPVAELPYHVEERGHPLPRTPVCRMPVLEGDLVRFQLDAIANPASRTLRRGSGLSNAVHLAAGPELAAACEAVGGCPPGSARMTDGFALPAGRVIHVVSPCWEPDEAGPEHRLRLAWTAALRLCEEQRIRTVAFPLLGSGNNGFPSGEAARVATSACHDWLAEHEWPDEVQLVARDRDTLMQLVCWRGEAAREAP